MGSLALWGLQALGFGKQIMRWEGFRSWKFWAGLACAVVLGWIILTNVALTNSNKELERDNQKQEQLLGDAVKNNQELQKVVARLQVGSVVDSSVIVSNQQELDRIRKEYDEREENINRQGSSGPAGSATICAITGVCPR